MIEFFTEYMVPSSWIIAKMGLVYPLSMIRSDNTPEEGPIYEYHKAFRRFAAYVFFHDNHMQRLQ